MAQVYCDIIPQSNGWVFVSDGVQSAAYPSYRLAVEAAKFHIEHQTGTRRTFVFRQQDLKGGMLEIGAMAQAFAPRASAAGAGRK
jgi:hypothetical protein